MEGVGFDAEELLSHLDLRYEAVQLRIGTEQIIPADLSLMPVQGIDAIGTLYKFMYPCGSSGDRLTDIEGVPLREVDTFLNAVDLELTSRVDELHFGLASLTSDD